MCALAVKEGNAVRPGEKFTGVMVLTNGGSKVDCFADYFRVVQG